MTSTPNTPALKSELSAAQLKSLKSKSSALASTETANETAIQSAFKSAFESSCDKHADLGAFFRSIDSDRSGSALHKAFETVGSGVFLTPNDRELVPSQSTVTRSIELHEMDTPARRTAFVGLYPSPKVPEYVQWLKLAVALDKGIDMSDVVATKDLLGNKSSVIIAESIVTDDKGVKSVGRLKRPTATPKPKSDTPATPVVSSVDPAITIPEWGAFESMSEEDLEAIPAVVDLSSIDPAMYEALAKQVVAAYLIRRNIAKRGNVLIGLSPV